MRAMTVNKQQSPYADSVVFCKLVKVLHSLEDELIAGVADVITLHSISVRQLPHSVFENRRQSEHDIGSIDSPVMLTHSTRATSSQLLKLGKTILVLPRAVQTYWFIATSMRQPVSSIFHISWDTTPSLLISS